MTTTLSVRLDPKLKSKLGKLAKATKRSSSFLAAEAIAAYVEEEQAHIQQIQEGLRDAAEGRFVEDEEIASRVRSWAREARLGSGSRTKRSR